MKKPVIGIISNEDYIDKAIYKKKVYDVNADYIKMISNKGGIPVIIPAVINIKECETLLKTIDGLLLIGGVDITKECYTKKILKDERDKLEIEIYKYFRKQHKPILGICRGLQLINVAEGGSLKNIKSSKIKHFIEEDGWVNHHYITISEDSKIYKIIKEKEYTVSSVHHQQIDKLGSNIKVAAKSSDGVIEAIESKDNDFVIAFQGHIEKCLNNFIKYNKVVDEFLKEARK